MSTKKRLFLLDAYALIFRGYYAFIKNPRINSKGLNTSAVLGFMNAVMEVIRKEKPDHLAVAFDKGGSDFRNEIFPTYKANRDETPEAIKIAVPYIHEILKAMHIPIIELSGYEADDLIGTLAKQAEKQNYQVFMVTPDKDFAQLVSENIFMYKPARSGNDVEIWGVEEVKKNFEIDDPLQVIDFLGMKGDAVDNIPGLPGVGDVTAKKLLKEFGSMENLIANTAKLKGSIKEKIEAHAEQGLLSKKLATILLDCPVTFNEKDYELSQPDFDQVTILFDELEFRQMKLQFEKIFNLQTSVPSEQIQKTSSSKKPNDSFDLFSHYEDENQTSVMNHFNQLSNTPHHYQVVAQGLGFELFLKSLMSQTSVCFDTETTALKTIDAELVGIAFSWEASKGFYLPIPENREEAMVVLDKLRPFFESESIEKVGQNMKYDIKVLFNYGIHVKGIMFDTMIAHYLINPDMRHNMDVLAETYLKYSPQPIDDLIGKKGKNQKNMRDVDLESIKEYAVEDADVTLQLKAHFEPILKETDTYKLYNEIEMPLINVLASMEYEGIKLDVDFLKSLSQDLTNDIKTLEVNIYEAAGHSFNIGSPKQLGEILFDQLKIGGSKIKKTKTGQYATGEEILSSLVKAHPIINDILDYRQLIKLQNTYVDALPLQVNSKTGRVHTDYLQTVAATGRLSSNNPNLQNIPIRTERGRQIRKAFVAKNEDYILLAADYSQIELRIIAALSQEENMIEAFRNNEDIHKSTASKVFNIPLSEVTKEQRSHAKTVNFGIIYGVSAFGLSNQTSLSRSESASLIDQYYQTYPKLKQFIQDQINSARQLGYVQTILGRRRYLPDIHSANAIVRGQAERNAVNAPIQGSAADIIKIAMINIHRKISENKFKSRMLLQVHDELVFDCCLAEKEELTKIIKLEMENAFKLLVPLDVEIGEGNNWLEAH
jgi:DNA polymerase-1